MKNRVKVLKTNYYMDSTNKVVICCMTCDVQMTKHLPKKLLSPKMWNTVIPEINNEGIFTVKAKARCCSSDTYNELIGKRISESRARQKALIKATKFWDCCAEWMNFYADIIESKAEACYDAYKEELKHEERLCE